VLELPLGTLLGALEGSKLGGLLGSGDFVGDAIPNMLLGLFVCCRVDGVHEGSELGVLLGAGDFMGEAKPVTLGL
jgi:hypothetical protein